MNQAVQIPQVMAEALGTGLFVSLCTISALPSPMALGPSGSPTDAFVAVTGLIDIRCMKSVVLVVLSSPAAYETKSTSRELTSNDWHVLLESYYPTITTLMRATIDDVVYDIVGVDQDSQSQMTRLRVRLASI